MVFSKKWLRNHFKFLLHFLIHTDVLMLCSKFELTPTNIFKVTSTYILHNVHVQCEFHSLITDMCLHRVH